MKQITIACLIALAAFTGCESWVDVSPKTDVKSEELFETEAGFKSALIGIYVRMTNDETYGKNLTYGFVEELVQRYDNYAANVTPTDAQRAEIYDYRNHTYSKDLINGIWREMYTNIANINNLLTYLAKNGDRVLKTPGYRALIEGEAHALRAFHYFDLLRLWGPVYAHDPAAPALPWRDELGHEKSSILPANEIMTRILADLHRAEELLQDDPMIYGRGGDDLFLGERRYRLNLYAVKALMARVYLYAGDQAQAARYAREVVENSGLSLVNNNTEDVAMSAECLFCLSMHNMESRVSADWKNSTNMDRERWISTENIRSVFEFSTIGINDIRYRNGYGFIHGLNRFMNRKYLGQPGGYANNIPLIRLGEIYLILAEALDPSEGYVYLNQLRNTRGIARAHNLGTGLTEAERFQVLNKEYQKEFFAEGQWFYFLKRHGVEQFYRLPVPRMIYYVWPIPDDEIEFGDV